MTVTAAGVVAVATTATYYYIVSQKICQPNHSYNFVNS